MAGGGGLQNSIWVSVGDRCHDCAGIEIGEGVGVGGWRELAVHQMVGDGRKETGLEGMLHGSGSCCLGDYWEAGVQRSDGTG